MSSDVQNESREILALVQRLFCAGDASRYGAFETLDIPAEQAVAVRIPGALYTVKLFRPDLGPCLLNLFTDIDDTLVGRLWDHEVRVLLRIRAIEHAALPAVQQGGYDAGERLAWMVIDAPDPRTTDLLNEDGVLDELRERPAAAAGHLLDLAEALSVLHGQGLVHRNIWPGAVTISGEGADARLRFERLEMSTLVTNIARGAAGDPTGLAHLARQMMRSGGVDQLRFMAPERLAHLLVEDERATFESDRADVFGLGAMAWEWFLGPMPVAPHVREDGTDRELLDDLSALHNTLRVQLQASWLPRPLADLLADMLRAEPTARPSSAEVTERLLCRYDGLMASLEPVPDSEEPPPLPLVFFMPDRADRTLGRWDAIQHPPTSREGIAQQRELIEREFARAKLVHSPRGALDFVSVESESGRRAAEWVFVGEEYAWFCVENRQQLGRGKGLGPSMPDVLRIMFVQPLYRQNTARLGNTDRYRRIGAVEALPYTNDDDVLASLRAGRPAWRPILDQIRRPDDVTANSQFLQALDWLLEHQQVEQQLREYPFIRTSGPGGDVHELSYDVDRDLPRIRDSGLYALLSNRGERAPFAQFFTSEEAYREGSRLEYVEDARGRPGRRGGAILETRMEGNDPSRLIVRVDKRSELRMPEKGWLRPDDYIAAWTNWNRQRRALGELRAQGGLVGQLRDPRQTWMPTGRWSGAGAGLDGDAPKIIERVLSAHLMFALHGPPGTGKTTVVAHAVDAYIRQEPGARVLIAAQANDALDNLALRVLRQLRGSGEEVIALRVGRDRDKIDPRLLRWTLDTVTERRASLARRVAQERIRAARDSQGVIDILREWIVAIERGTLELQERVRRGASVVFATCSGSDGLVANYGRFSIFDWVIAEEAAKAWPTELAIPLVQGIRWTLVGDHRQLPAYRRDEVTRVLESCQYSEDEELKAVYERREEFEAAFDFFRLLFDPPTGRPVAQLTRQFRMREPIADAVSAAFYEPLGDEPLVTDPGANCDPGVVRPTRLRGRAFVWLDTTDAPSQQEPRWRNRDEARYVARLLELLSPVDRDGEGRACPLHERLAVLTPWRAQVLELRLQADQKFGEVFHTVDSFQGREADIVVSSLVRDRPRSPDKPYENLGHAVHAHRMNVMLSRARGLNVVVGSFSLFSKSGVSFWEDVCRHVERIPVLEVIGS